ncbi:MAG: hypothetical protein DRJ02_10070 [Bacteroidetes bacterium]|nr:MAG: hypothetical protein DRJ02_10070 [Bacteroidota bacterium]
MAPTKKYIPLQQLAKFHQVSVALITEFADFGLIEITYTENTPCVHSHDMERCERALRLYKELGINKEGIEIILEMRERQAELQEELSRLKHMLKKYEEKISSFYSDDFLDME